MIRRAWEYFLEHWAEPLGPVPAWARPVLGALALLLRLYVAGVIGFVMGLIGRSEVPVLGVVGFLSYGYDKLLGGNLKYGMDAEFFRVIGVPFPEVTAVFIGALELFGGLAVLVGLLTRPFSLALAGTMVVALVTVNNWPEELPLLVACLLLVWLGGGLLAVDQLLERRIKARQGRPRLAIASTVRDRVSNPK
jgi:putative oxidoreductase